MSDLSVYGTHLTLDVRQLRLTANTNGEVFQILHAREDGGINRGGVVALRESTVVHRADGPHAITQLQLWIQVPGAFGGDVKVFPATYAVWARLDGREIDQQLQGAGYGPDVTFGLRLTHATACNIVNYGTASCGFSLMPRYEVFISRDPSVIDSGHPAAGYRRYWTDMAGVTASRVTTARHEVRAGPLPETAGPGKYSNESDVLDVTLKDHHVYFVGCYNCLEGCELPNPDLCLPGCPTRHELGNWMRALDNVAPISPGFARSYNGYRVYDNSQPPPISDPDYCDYTPDQFHYQWSSSAFSVCKGYVENTPCACVPSCVECATCDGLLDVTAHAAWPVPWSDVVREFGTPGWTEVGPWFCVYAQVASFLTAAIPHNVMDTLPHVTQFDQGAVWNGNACGSGCGFYVDVPEVSFHMHRLTAVSKETGPYTGLYCGGQVDTIPPQYHSQRWIADNSSSRVPFTFELYSHWSWNPANNGQYYSAKQGPIWVRFHQDSDQPTAIPVLAVPTSPPGYPTPRPLVTPIQYCPGEPWPVATGLPTPGHTGGCD